MLACTHGAVYLGMFVVCPFLRMLHKLGYNSKNAFVP